ncbi:MAG: mannose-1-phosphate guanylyltransferase [Bacteroidota bacterium]
MKHQYCVIMAGGVGSRFWPYSRTPRPKQFLDILGVGRTLLQQTYDRFRKIMPPESIYIVSNSEYGDLIAAQLEDIPVENILLEPLRRNTAPCIDYANYRILKKDPEAVIVVAPSDHLIIREDVFLSAVGEGLDFAANNDALLTMGIVPSRPETGYGYIQAMQKPVKNYEKSTLRKVKTFTEKPNAELAQVFYKSGEFHWNAGIFFWSLKTIMNAFENHLPDIHTLFKSGEDLYGTPEETGFISSAYTRCKSISIDYGILEKADNVYVLVADYGWSDLGTWGSLYEHLDKDKQKNAVTSKHAFMYETSGSIVKVPGDKLVVIQGLQDYIVVDTDDVLLVCRKSEEQRIKQFVNDIRTEMGDEFM